MAQTLSNLRYWTQYVVGDPQMTTYSLQMYTDAINYAIKDYATKTGATYAESTAIVPDSNGFVVLPTDYIKVQRVLFNVGGTTLTQLAESSFNFEGLANNQWEGLTQATAGFPPKRWVLFQGGKVKLTPIPSPAYTATVGYVQAPAALINNTDLVDTRIPDAHNEYLKYAAASWLLSLDGDAQSIPVANVFMDKFNELIGFTGPTLDNAVKGIPPPRQAGGFPILPQMPH